METISLTENEFDEQFHMVKNHLDKHAAFDGNMYETYGKEIDFIHKAMSNNYLKWKVWTIIDGDNDDLMYVSGYHIVNRIGFFITEEAVPEGTEISVLLEIEMS
jgi:hypothetical protein